MVVRSVCKGAAVALLVLAPSLAMADTVSFNQPLASPGGGISGTYFGTGNANQNWTVETTGEGWELGLGINQRFVSPITPVPPDGSNYNVPLGADSGGHALWDILFSVDLEPNGPVALGPILNDITADVTITDTTTGSTVVFSLFDLPDNNCVGVGTGTTAVDGPGHTPNTCNTSTDWAMQNSENLSFGFLKTPLAFDPNSTDGYSVTLSVDSIGVPDPSLSITINQVPEPASLALLGSALLGLGGFGLRRRRRN